MSHFVAYILQFQEIIVYKIPPGGRGSVDSLRSMTFQLIGQRRFSKFAMLVCATAIQNFKRL